MSRYKGTEFSVVSSKSPNSVEIKLLLRIRTQLAICFYEGGFVNAALEKATLKLFILPKRAFNNYEGGRRGQ